MTSALVLALICMLPCLSHGAISPPEPNGAGADIVIVPQAAGSPTANNGAKACGENVDARQVTWKQHSSKRQAMQYRIIAAEACEDMARRMEDVC